jgi:hypothetical protein
MRSVLPNIGRPWLRAEVAKNQTKVLRNGYDYVYPDDCVCVFLMLLFTVIVFIYSLVGYAVGGGVEPLVQIVGSDQFVRSFMVPDGTLPMGQKFK